MSNKKFEANVACSHLSFDENELVFSLINEHSFSLCTVVVEMYETLGPTHSVWNRVCAGILCFEKDYKEKSYFFRLYCLMRREMKYEQEIYRQMENFIERPYLLTFEGKVRKFY